MPTKTYPLEEDGPDRVELSWGRKFKNFTIKLDGQQLNPEPYDLQSLRAGQQVDLRDGTKLRVAFQRGSTGGLSVTRDGKPLPGSPSHPVSKAKGASVLMFVIAGFNALFLALLFTREDVPSLALATTGAWIAVFVVLGLFVRRGSLGALWAGIALFGLDTVTLLFTGDIDFSWVIVRAILLVGLWQSLPALRQLKQEREGATAF